MEWFVTAPNGRTLAVEDAGDPGGRPVMVHVGTPGGRRLYGQHMMAAAKHRGLRLISYDRPGYGGSTSQPGRSFADTAADVRAICADQGITRLPMFGSSGGGPPLLACAALLPDLVPAAAALASPAPIDAEGLDWLAGFSAEAVEEVRVMQQDVPAARAYFRRECDAILNVPPEQAARDSQWRTPGADLAVLTEEFAAMQLALAPGIEGSWEDCVAQITPWGFDVAQIAVPVLLLHGREDTAVPFAHGQWLAAHIPRAETRFYDGEGHDLRERHIEEIIDWLTDR